MKCEEKNRFASRLEAEHALSVARSQWQQDPGRCSNGPPIRVYQCPLCGYGWHLTHHPTAPLRDILTQGL